MQNQPVQQAVTVRLLSFYSPVLIKFTAKQRLSAETMNKATPRAQPDHGARLVCVCVLDVDWPLSASPYCVTEVERNNARTEASHEQKHQWLARIQSAQLLL